MKNILQLVQPETIPISLAEIKALGWDKLKLPNNDTDIGSLDISLVSGDALVDHPSFGTALLARWLIAHGFRTAVLPQPRWEAAPKDALLQDFSAMPRPRLFAGVTAGAIDSMLAHYTAFRKKRSDDAYTPGGKAGARPNRASLIYTGLLRQAFPGIPVLIGGLEASLRRVSHYDFWTDALRRSILLDSKADLLLYGMSEYSILDVASAAHELWSQHDFANKDKDSFRKSLASTCRFLPGVGTAVSASQIPTLMQEIEGTGQKLVEIPSHEEILQDHFKLMQATQTLEQTFHQQQDFLLQKSADRAVLLPPPAKAMNSGDLDLLYGLPFSRRPHPSYKEPIPAWEMIRTSITTHRGCGGGCSFCSLALHQGRHLASRSRKSILEEVSKITEQKDSGGKIPRWTASISDVGGPSANMWQGSCTMPENQRCRRASCLFPAPCPNFSVDQKKAVALLREIAVRQDVRHVRVASGVRFDMALQDQEVLRAYTMEFTGGQLKVAPEHICDPVLKLMRKPSLQSFERFLEAFGKYSKEAGQEQYVIPYIISAFPGCTDENMQELGAWFKARNWNLQQVQCFIPTPGTIATAMYYSEKDPSGKDIHVAKTDAERLQQHYRLFEDKRERDPRANKGSKDRKNFQPAKNVANNRERGDNKTGRDNKSNSSNSRVRDSGRRGNKA